MKHLLALVAALVPVAPGGSRSCHSSRSVARHDPTSAPSPGSATSLATATSGFGAGEGLPVQVGSL